MEYTYDTYDACGARTSDANKGIASIKYSYWGTPELIQFTNGCQTRYVYNADGVKLKRIHITAVDNIVVPLKTVMELSGDQILTSDTTEYCGNFIFENGKLDKVLFSSGYVSCNSDNEQEYFTFHYYVKDHLGNNRAVISEDGHIEQTTHYYPFGNSFADAGTNSALQHYKYNGKELDRMHGLDWYDYGARNYDPVILQWDRPDPLADKYYPVSPYVYCHDNPVNKIDADGTEDYTFNKDGFFYESTSLLEKIRYFWGFGSGKDRIYREEDNRKPILEFERGTIKELVNNKDYTKFEITNSKDANIIFQKLINQTDVEWAHIRHSSNQETTGSSTLINNHDNKDVSSSTIFSNEYKNSNENILLFEHSHPLYKEFKESGLPNLPFQNPPSKADMQTSGRYPKTKFRVYDIYNKTIYEYDKNGIKKVLQR